MIAPNFVADENSDDIKVATITNNSQRIVRLVVKFGYSFTIESASMHHAAYEWINQYIHLGKEEILAMAEAIKTLPEETQHQEGGDAHD